MKLTVNCNHVHDETNHRLLVRRIGFGHQQSQRRQPDVVDHWIAAVIQQPGITVEKVHEEKRASALVAIVLNLIGFPIRGSMCKF